MTRQRPGRGRSAVALALAVAAVLAGCSGDDAGAQDRLTATLKIITTRIQSAVDGDAFEPARPGQELAVGDKVKTDDTGFAEITYHDGSWQRVENNATLTVLALTENGPARTVRTGIDIGRTWNRVRELGEPEDAYEVETPVATASVRGTSFATDCPTADRCTFRVIEGTIVITTRDGESVTVTAPAVLEVQNGEPLGQPQPIPPDVLRRDPWVEKNLGADRERIRRDGEPGSSGRDGERGAPAERPTPGELVAARLEGPFRGERRGVSSNYRTDHPNAVPAGSTTARSYTFAPRCDDDGCIVTLAGAGSPDPQPLTFDGTAYVQREELVADCVDPATGEPLAPGVARVVVEGRWTPTSAQRVDGEWVVDAVEATVRTTTQILRPDQFTNRCTWPTADGAAPAQSVTASARRAG